LNNSRLIIFLGLVSFILLGTPKIANSQIIEADTASVVSTVIVRSPHKATMYSVMFPGLGQAYNKKYWKIPILYAGIGATIYAISWNTKYYKIYKTAYADFSNYYDYKYQDDDEDIEEPTGSSYEDLLDVDFSETSSSYDSWFKSTLLNKKDSYKQDRDLSYIILAGVYVLNIVDAAIDAHFTNFNVNNDLTIKVEPAINYSAFTGKSLGLKCQITF
jgi:hypothetical protein